MEEKVCPICPRHCDLSNPHCPRGATYAQTGEMPAQHEHHKHHLKFEKRECQLIMKYLHHAVRCVDSGDLGQDMADKMFEGFTDEEIVLLANMLEKLSDHWFDLVKNKEK